MDFAVDVIIGCNSQKGPDASTTIGDKTGGRGSVFLDFGF
jgi:hypothetical protein